MQEGYRIGIAVLVTAGTIIAFSNIFGSDNQVSSVIGIFGVPLAAVLGGIVWVLLHNRDVDKKNLPKKNTVREEKE